MRWEWDVPTAPVLGLAGSYECRWLTRIEANQNGVWQVVLAHAAGPDDEPDVAITYLRPLGGPPGRELQERASAALFSVTADYGRLPEGRARRPYVVSLDALADSVWPGATVRVNGRVRAVRHVERDGLTVVAGEDFAVLTHGRVEDVRLVTVSLGDYEVDPGGRLPGAARKLSARTFTERVR